jgi:hypothetical protein
MASTGLVVIDLFLRPFAKIYEKMPLVMLLILMIIYGVIGYIVVKSAYVADQG